MGQPLDGHGLVDLLVGLLWRLLPPPRVPVGGSGERRKDGGPQSVADGVEDGDLGYVVNGIVEGIPGDVVCGLDPPGQLDVVCPRSTGSAGLRRCSVAASCRRPPPLVVSTMSL